MRQNHQQATFKPKASAFGILFDLGVFLAILLGFQLRADVVILQNGQVIDGKVLQQDDDGVLVQMNYGTFRYPKSLVKDVRKENVNIVANANDTYRIPSWAEIISTLATNSWVHELKQIPATVIDNGVLKDVPYISFRCNSGGYEINIYGDLDRPAGVEIGAINYLVKSDEAKSNCVKFISFLLNPSDRAFIRVLNLHQKDLQKRDGLSFETTFPDEPDAYGGWWISVYDESELTNARASGPELLAITQPRTNAKTQPVYLAVQPTAQPQESDNTWESSDILNSRSGATGYSSSDRVYVRGYYRKDGTYVQSYTRSYPHRR